MNFVEYIQNGTNLSGGKSTGWMINFGRYPTANTKIEIKFKHQNSTVDGGVLFGCHHYDFTKNYFRLFTYQMGTYFLDSPDDGNSRISVPVTFNQEVTLQATPAPNLSLTNLNTQRTATATNGATLNYKYPMAMWYGFDGDSGEVVEGTQIFYIKIWESDTLVMDLWPAVDNGVVGLYDKIGGQMYTNTGSDKTFTIGGITPNPGYVEYVETDGRCWFDTGIIPNINTRVEMEITPLTNASWKSFLGAENVNDDDNYTFQIRRRDYDGFNPRIGDWDYYSSSDTYEVGSTYSLILDRNGFTKNGVFTQGSVTTYSVPSNSLYISACHNPNYASSNYRAALARYGRIKIYDNNVLVGDFRPYVDSNLNVGFYDTVSETFKANLGTGTPKAGLNIASIYASASKTTLPSTGETIDIDVTCSNSWTVTQTGNWLTLSEASGTGNTTITATAPSYTGTTDRTTTLTFTDTTTSDIVELTIKQKKYVDGQPFYLGANEVNEAYLGAIEITEAYLGDVLVFSASAPAPTPGGDITITIDGADACIGGDPMMGDCPDISAYTYSIVTIDPSDDTELSVVATVNLEREGDGMGDPYVWSIASSTLPQGVTASIDDSDGWDLLIEGSFNTANTYAVKCVATTPDDYVERWGYANDNGDYQFNLSTDVTLTPDFTSGELMPLRTLTVESIPTVPNEATHIEVTDDDKFGIEIAWVNDDVETSVWTGDEGSGDRITVTYDDAEQTITIEADWDAYDGEGSGEYTIRMKADTDSCTVADGDEGTYSLQWQSNELTKTITFDGGTCTPNE